MVEIRGIFFWLTGVYSQSLPIAVAQALSQACDRAVNPMALPNFAARLEALATGQIDGTAFCQALGAAASAEEGPESLRDRILEGLTPNPGVLEATRLLPDSLRRWLVVDLPVDWFERIAGPLQLGTGFAPGRMIYLTTSHLPRLIPDLFYRLAYLAELPMQDCLLIDASAKRAVQALKHGLSTELYVDTRRLERMFVMRNFINRPHPVHKPETSL